MVEIAEYRDISTSLSMPKDKKVQPSSTRRSKSSPYPSPTNDNEKKLTNMCGTSKEVKEWEETRCPICMEHPHSAVLLVCSSRDKGCRPYMCNTGNRHSNCLYQFQKSHETSVDTQSKLPCPLCRGETNGWVVIESARQFMNSKPRSCPSETCEHVGNYIELRNHIRREHPDVKPSNVDTSREREWLRLERERELKDVLCFMLADMGDHISFAAYENLLNSFLSSIPW